MLQISLHNIISLVLATLFISSLLVSDFSGNIHFQIIKKDDIYSEAVNGKLLNRQTISIDKAVEVYQISKHNNFMNDLIKSFTFWDFAFKESNCKGEFCKIEEKDSNILYNAVFNDYLFLDLDKVVYQDEDENNFQYEINWNINQENNPVWSNAENSRRLKPLSTFYTIHKILKNSNNDEEYLKSEDWTNSLFNVNRKNNSDVINNNNNSSKTLDVIFENIDNYQSELNYSSEDIIEVFEFALKFINDFFYQIPNQLSPIDIYQDNSDSLFYLEENSELYKDFLVSSGERLLTTTILQLVRNACNYNYKLFNQNDIDFYIKNQKMNVWSNYMSQYWLMSNLTFTNNLIEYQKTNGPFMNHANRYYSIKIDKNYYETQDKIVRTDVNEFKERKIKITEAKKFIVPIWEIYILWFLMSLVSLSTCYFFYRKKIMRGK
ncbi:hypothetical protein [Spiroplasma sabaudiense]|uniref:hypothetical protein n=1 Tax=Spiroplasma sabaudiense TaxID=216944 RepID=UPI0011DE59B3|nr:hypothetical protein [Spiroplasma sabaudiense]